MFNIGIDRASQQTTEILREILVVAMNTRLVMDYNYDGTPDTVNFPDTWKNFIGALEARIAERESQSAFEARTIQQAYKEKQDNDQRRVD